MIGNQIDQFTRQGSQKTVGAVLTMLLALVLLVLMFYYLRTTRRAEGASALMPGSRNPWGTPALPAAGRGALHLLVDRPGRDRDRCSRSTTGARARPGRASRCAGSTATRPAACRHDPALQGALKHTLVLALICVAVATPLGVALALGLQRWRGAAAARSNALMLLPLVTPEIVMGVALLLLFLQVFTPSASARTAQAIGQITFTLSYVVVMVRGRLVSIGPEYEEAAADLGAPPLDVLCRVLLPLLAPAILASAAVVFALSIDDFVVTQYLAGGADTTTVLDAALLLGPRSADAGAQRAGDDHACITLVTLALVFFVYRRFAGGERRRSGRRGWRI